MKDGHNQHPNPIVEAFSRRARRRPDDFVVVSGSSRTTAAAVADSARELAAALRRRSLGAGDLVALSAPNGPQFLASLLAILESGATVLPLDHNSPTPEIAAISGALSVNGLVRFPDGRPGHPGAAEVTVLTTERLSGDLPASGIVKLTSGTTGAPRGILLSSEALIADERALAATMSLTREERILAAIPMSHSYGLSSVVMPALMRDAILVVPGSTGPLAPIRECRTHGVTFLPTVPAFLNAFVEMAKAAPVPPSLRLVVSAGAPLPPATARQFREIYGIPVHVFYGASECGGISFDRIGNSGEAGDVGTPVDGVDIRIEGGDLSHASKPGRISITSPAVATGYFPDPDPCLSHGTFHSNDLASIVDGQILLAGRTDDLVDVKGKQVNPREVEKVLLMHDGTSDAVVVGEASARHSGNTLRAYVVSGEALDASQLQDWCTRHLASYKVPRSIVVVERIPRTSRGKVDRGALALLSRKD